MSHYIHIGQVDRENLPPLYQIVSSDGVEHGTMSDLRQAILELRRIAKRKGYKEGLVHVSEDALH